MCNKVYGMKGVSLDQLREVAKDTFETKDEFKKRFNGEQFSILTSSEDVSKGNTPVFLIELESKEIFEAYMDEIFSKETIKGFKKSGHMK